MAPKLTATEWVMLPFRLLFLWLRIIGCYCEALYKVFVPTPPKSLRSKVVLITGAGGGIGRPMALKFAQHGARLALWDINQAACDATAALVKESGGTAFSYVCDITSVDKVKQAAANTHRDLGDVDIVVNNAGIMIVKPFLNLSERDIRQTFEINSVAHFWVLQQFLPAMLERKDGHVVTIASMAGRGGVPLLTDYCASKWAAIGFTEALSEEVRRKGIDIKFTTVCPMFVNTNLVNGVRDRAVMQNKYGKLLQPEDVAEAIVEGVRRNKHFVYVPPNIGGAVLLGALLPKKARSLVVDFIDSSFIEVSKKE